MTSEDAPRDHLVRVRRDGQSVLVCQVCYHQVSVGADGVEYGHQRYAGNRGGADGRCPYRPDSVDPSDEELPACFDRDEEGKLVRADSETVCANGGESR